MARKLRSIRELERDSNNQYQRRAVVTPSQDGGVRSQGLCDLPNKQCSACENGQQTCVIPGGRYPAFTCSC